MGKRGMARERPLTAFFPAKRPPPLPPLVVDLTAGTAKSTTIVLDGSDGLDHYGSPDPFNKVKRQCLALRAEECPYFPNFIGAGHMLYPAQSERDCENYQFSRRTRETVLPSPFKYGGERQCPIEFNELSHPKRKANFDFINRVFEDIMKKLQKTPPEPVDDEDDWLPQGFREMQVRSSNSCSIRNVFLVTGRSGIGKSHLATGIAEQLGAEYVELNSVGTGSAGERLARVFDDLLVSSRHQALFNARMAAHRVVLIDEIDLLFPGDSQFPASLSAYLSRLPSSHIVVMTSNAPLRFLSTLYSFPPDIQVFEWHSSPEMLQERDDYPALDVESLSFVNANLCGIRKRLIHAGPQLISTVSFDSDLEPCLVPYLVRDSFEKYSALLLQHRLPPTGNRLACWAELYLPAWSAMERARCQVEENRQLSRRRASRSVGSQRNARYIRGMPNDICDRVRNW